MQPSEASLRAAAAAKTAAAAAETTRVLLEKELKKVQQKLLSVEKEKKESLLLSNERLVSSDLELSKRLETQRTASDTRLMQERRRYQKMKTHLEEERENALHKLQRVQEQKRYAFK
mgnify:CR=1 FL=1